MAASLIDDIINNPDSLKDVTKDDLLELRKKVNPYGIVLNGEKSWINLSITNIKDMYLRRIHMTSLVGFMYRAFDDYTFELSEEQMEELNDIKDIDEKHKKEQEFRKQFAEEKRVTKKFIDRQFKFNPDKHISKAGIRESAGSEIPADAFYHWDRYLSNNYEKIVETVGKIYGERHDIEYAIQYMDCFKSEEEAKEHVKRNADSFITPIFTITNNAWTLLGPFKENRERIEFYNKNTDVLKEMIAQVEKDTKLGKEIMEKRRVLNKKENVALEGPDDRGLAEYSAALGTIEAIGNKPNLSAEEKKVLAQAKKIKDDTEVPKDAMGIDMFYTDAADGEFKRSRFHTDVIEPKKN